MAYLEFGSRGGLVHGGSPVDVGEVHVTYVKQQKGWRTSCEVGEATEGLNNEL